jgi:hypothetical protein
MGPRFTSFWPLRTLALMVAVVGCSPLKSSAKAIPQDAAADAKLHGDGGPPVSSATGGNSGRGGRPSWGDDEPAGVGGMQGTGSDGGSGGEGPNNDGGPNGGTSGSTGGAGGSGQGGSTGQGGAGGSAAGGGMVGSGTGGASNTGGRGGTSGAGTGGVEIPINNSDGTGGAPAGEVFVPPPPADDCANAAALPLKLAHMNLPVTTKGANASMAGPCGPAAPDVFFSFNIATREAVYADTFGSTWNTMVFFAKSCTGAPVANLGGPTACSDDACGTMQSQAVAILEPGRYLLVISGAAGQSGDATVHFEHAPLGSGPTAVLPPGTNTLTGTTTGSGNLEFCEAGAADNSYWWTTCPSSAGGAFTAATCGGTHFDSVMSLQIPRIPLARCNDDACGFQSRVVGDIPAGAGLQVVSVDGSTGRQAGPYSMTVTRP